MTENSLHFFRQPIGHIPLPERFTYPFNYTPHLLCVIASQELQAYLEARADWHDELAQGKMFGVLVVQTTQGEIGYLAAFSGNLAGRNDHSHFVPPVFDLLQKDGYFKLEETEISAINREIGQLTGDPGYLNCKSALEEESRMAGETLAREKERLRAAKEMRDAYRKTHPDMTEESRQELIARSQFEKAELKRLSKRLQDRLDELAGQLAGYTTALDRLRAERKRKSAALQQKLFDSFRMLNIRGEERGLCSIFAQTVQKVPPAGAGECAAPKLLQYAFFRGWKPLAMAEFWWGASPATEIRHHGQFYPACKGKCEPILAHMLVGMELEADPLQSTAGDLPDIELLYEDDYLLVIHKPAGMLSVPGKSNNDSVAERIRQRYPSATGPLVVHRLDMSTSGLLLIGKTLDIYRRLQAMFAARLIRKRYVALLDGMIPGEEGEVDLPLSPDYLHRPRQQVDFESGKPALTHWRVIGRQGAVTRVELSPITGRTHQLRMHAAHPCGLHAPILGDELYGRKSERLYLHAFSLEFEHPCTGQLIRVEKPADF